MNNQIKKFLFLIFQFIFFTNLKLCKTYQKYNSWTIKFFVKLNFYKIKIHSTRIFNIKHFIDNKYDTQDHLIDTIIDFEVISRDYEHDEIQEYRRNTVHLSNSLHDPCCHRWGTEQQVDQICPRGIMLDRAYA